MSKQVIFLCKGAAGSSENIYLLNIVCITHTPHWTARLRQEQQQRQQTHNKRSLLLFSSVYFFYAIILPRKGEKAATGG